MTYISDNKCLKHLEDLATLHAVGKNAYGTEILYGGCFLIRFPIIGDKAELRNQGTNCEGLYSLTGNVMFLTNSFTTQRQL